MISREGKGIEKALAELGVHTFSPYETIYKYATVENAIKILANQTLLYQSPAFFNDPFDCFYGFADCRKAAERILNERFVTIFENVTEEHKRIITPDQLERTTDELIRQHMHKAGIFCASLSNVHTLLWSHYGDKHRGICLGFKGLGSDPKGVSAFKVRYTDDIIPVNLPLDNGFDDVLALVRMICSKAEVWSYEEEVRVIDFEKNGLFPFQKNDLCEIYFGVGTKTSDIDTILQLAGCKGYDVRFKKMKIEKNKFKLNITEL